MRFTAVLFLLCVPLAFGSADKKLPLEQSSNELIEIQASVLDKEQVRHELGTDLEGIVVVRMKVRPLSEKAFKIDRDDIFLLQTYDGQRSTPYAPSQIAGNSTLVVGSQGTRGSMTGGRNGPAWGGIGGRPSQLPGNSGGMGSTTVNTTEATATVKNGDKREESPLLKALKEKVLPEKEVTDPVEGLLYFQVEGKWKVKDLELYYKTPGGKLALRFRP